MLTIFSILLENRRLFYDLNNCGWRVWRAIFTSYTVLYLLTNLLPPEHVVCGKVMFSVVSVCHPVCSQEVAPCDLFKLVHFPPSRTCWQAGGWLSTEKAFLLLLKLQRVHVLGQCEGVFESYRDHLWGCGDIEGWINSLYHNYLFHKSQKPGQIPVKCLTTY